MTKNSNQGGGGPALRELRTCHVNHTHTLTRQNALQPLWSVQNISLQRREHFNVSPASSAIEAISRHRRQNHKGVCDKSQRDRHERCQPHAAPTALTNRSEEPVFGQGLNSAVLHYPSKTFSFIILDPSRRSNLGPLDLEKKSTSRRFFQIGPRTTLVVSQNHWCPLVYLKASEVTFESAYESRSIVVCRSCQRRI